MNETDKKYFQVNEEIGQLLKSMADETDPAAILKLDKQCALKIQELRGMSKTIQ